jgi:O-antigen ligase
MLYDHPLRGTGAGNFAIVAPRYVNMPERAADGRPGPVAHNVFLGLAAELGAPGALLFAIVLYGGFRRARRAAPADPLGASLLLGLIAYLLIGMTLSWEYCKVGYVLLGSVLALDAETGGASPEDRSVA